MIVKLDHEDTEFPVSQKKLKISTTKKKFNKTEIKSLKKV